MRLCPADRSRGFRILHSVGRVESSIEDSTRTRLLKRLHNVLSPFSTRQGSRDIASIEYQQTQSYASKASYLVFTGVGFGIQAARVLCLVRSIHEEIWGSYGFETARVGVLETFNCLKWSPFSVSILFVLLYIFPLS